MPPPPPSASYLLNLDEFSSSDEEEEFYDASPYRIRDEEHCAVAAASPPVSVEAPARHGLKHAHSTSSSTQQDRDTEDNENGTSGEDDSSNENESENKNNSVAENDNSLPPGKLKLTKGQKKNRNKKKRKKKKIKALEQAGTQTQANDTLMVKRVAFGSVTIQPYTRTMGLDAVPVDGGWPLGLDEAIPEESFSLSIEEHQSERQQILKDRWESLSPSCTDAQRASMLEHGPVLESRQWDYKRGVKNPLFRSLVEEERQALLLQKDSKLGGTDGGTSHESLLSSSPPSPKRRLRSNSMHDQRGHGGRTRSNSVAQDESFSETYDQVTVHHVRNELEKLRNDRSSLGCSCRKLSVYLPPKDGGGGKKAQHRRLKPAKLTAELKKRGMYNPNASREELEQLLHDTVEQEPCCKWGDCSCKKESIECQADTCSCWYDSHVHVKTGSTGSNNKTPAEIISRCGNPHGTITVDVAAIDSFRESIIKQYCLPVLLDEEDVVMD